MAPAGFGLGLDISGPMLEAARQRAHTARLSNAIFEHGDAQTYQLATGIRRRIKVTQLDHGAPATAEGVAPVKDWTSRWRWGWSA